MTFAGPRNAYFSIAMPQYRADRTLGNIINQEDILSLSISEEQGKSVQGSFELNDPCQLYAKILRLNAQMQISWGYKANGAPIESLFGAANADLFSKVLERRGLNVLVLNPSGRCDGDGNSRFSCGFLSMGWFGEAKFTTYDTGTKRDCVSAALTRMGASPVNQFVYFDRENDSFSSASVERQSETDFQFLSRLASDWRCILQLGYKPTGETYAAFYGFANADAAWKNIALFSGTPLLSSKVSWKYFDRNDMMVISYDWRNEQGENGEGDNVQIRYVNGQPIYQRFTIENEQVVTWILDTEAVTQYVKAGNSLGPILSKDSFNDPEIKQFWKSSTQTTAPNGLGYTINLHMLGNPAVQVGMILTFNKGFPPCLCLKDGAPIRFIVRKLTHTISQSGYFMDAEVVDLLTISAVGVR